MCNLLHLSMTDLTSYKVTVTELHSNIIHPLPVLRNKICRFYCEAQVKGKIESFFKCE